jgi:FG-GAP-like repeat
MHPISSVAVSGAIIACLLVQGPCASQSLFTTPALPVVGTMPGGAFPYGIVHADFNNDGIIDALVGSGGSSQVQVLLGTLGGGVGQAIVTTFAPNGTQAQGPVPIVAWDVNQDGNMDAVCWMTGGTRVIIGTGNGSFSSTLYSPTVAPPFATSVYDLAGADLDNDGNVEVVIVGADAPFNPTGSIAVVHTAAPAGFLYPIFTYAPPGQFLARVVIGDVTGDGLKDVILEHGTPIVGLVVLQRAPTGGFSVLGPFNWPGSTEMVVGDVNNDAIDDIVSMVPSGTAPSYTIQISVAYGNTSGTFSVGATNSTSLAAGLIGVPYARSTLEDYDLDGLREIGTGSRLIRVLPAHSGGESSIINPLWYDSAQWPPGVSGFCPQDTFDADGDGDLDVLFIGKSGFSVTTLYAGIAMNRTISGAACSATPGAMGTAVGTPAPGNPAFALTLFGAPPNVPVALGLSNAEGFNPVGPCLVRLDLSASQLILPVGGLGILTSDGSGVAQAMFSIPSTVTLIGTDYFVQWIAMDPAGPISLLGINYSLSGTRRIILW